MLVRDNKASQIYLGILGERAEKNQVKAHNIQILALPQGTECNDLRRFWKSITEGLQLHGVNDPIHAYQEENS